MEKKLPILNTGYKIGIDSIPLECSFCHQSQVPEMHATYKNTLGTHYIFCICSNSHCGAPFIILYDENRKLFADYGRPPLRKKEFPDVINELSPLFCEIYNQAYSSEQMGLDQISGVGYRKAMEFLIKDYLISLHPDKEDKIKNKFLGKCIKEDVTDTRIKNVAERAAWLGNDETHYVRKWEDKDISHLKGLIGLCLHWIEAEINTKRILEEMPG